MAEIEIKIEEIEELLNEVIPEILKLFFDSIEKPS